MKKEKRKEDLEFPRQIFIRRKKFMIVKGQNSKKNCRYSKEEILA